MFLTPSGRVAPQAYQGLSIPPGGLVEENVGDFVQNDGVHRHPGDVGVGPR